MKTSSKINSAIRTSASTKPPKPSAFVVKGD